MQYECGHNPDEIIFLDGDRFTLEIWFAWKNSVGWAGNKSMCFECFVKKFTQMISEEARSRQL